MKNIKITIEVDGNEVNRNFNPNAFLVIEWQPIIEDMLDTLSKSNESMK